jgi:hypothetical protein
MSDAVTPAAMAMKADALNKAYRLYESHEGSYRTLELSWLHEGGVRMDGDSRTVVGEYEAYTQKQSERLTPERRCTNVISRDGQDDRAPYPQGGWQTRT